MGPAVVTFDPACLVAGDPDDDDDCCDDGLEDCDDSADADAAGIDISTSQARFTIGGLLLWVRPVALQQSRNRSPVRRRP